MNKKWILMIVSLMAIAVLVACGDKDGSKKDDGMIEDLPEANLDNIPDVVLEVNGEKINKDEFSNMYMQQFQETVLQLQMTGQSVDGLDQDVLKKQMAENLVDQSLITQEANNRIKEVSDDEIDNFITEFLGQTEFETKDELLAAFNEQGTDEEAFHLLVADEVRINNLIDEITKDVKVTADETKEYYELLKDQQNEIDSDEEFPSFDEIKNDIEQQLMAQKRAEETEAFVNGLRENADIKIHL